MLDGLTILDAHMHYAYPISEDSLIGALKDTGVDYVSLAALPGPPRLDPTPDILAIKARYPARIFAFGCMDCTDYHKRPAGLSRRLIARAKRLLAAGCDGIKLLEGKPTMRRQYPIPDFDAPAWDGFWTFAEETRLPILWHVNDPASFWDEKLVSARAREQGWAYGADTIKDSEQYRQVRAVLDKHNTLRVCFAHFFFLSAQLPRLSEWLERFPNMYIDLTPGIEVFEELSQTPDETHAFLTRFHERVLYGTDTGGRAAFAGAREINRAETERRAEIVRDFLMQKGAMGIRADGEYLIGTEPFVLHRMGLERSILEDIFYKNFLRFVGRDAPAPVDNQKAQQLCRRAMRSLRIDARRRHTVPDLAGAQNALDRLLLMREEDAE